MKITCDVVRDLLPLYTEKMTSNDTKELVEEHLLACPDCRRKADQMNRPGPQMPHPDTEPLTKIQKQIHSRRKLTAWFAFLVTASVIFGLFAYLSSPVYLTAEEAGIKVIKGNATSFLVDIETLEMTGADPEEEREILIVEMGPRVRTYSVDYWNESDMGTGPECATFIAADSRWNTFFGKKEGASRHLILSEDIKNVFYSSLDGSADALLWGPGINGGVQFLPRLVLGYYLLIAAALGAALMVCAFVFRGKKAGRVLAISGSYLLCFAAADLLITGGNWRIFDGKDVPILLTLMLVLAVLMCAAVFTGWEVWKQHKQDKA